MLVLELDQSIDPLTNAFFFSHREHKWYFLPAFQIASPILHFTAALVITSFYVGPLVKMAISTNLLFRDASATK